MWSNIDQSKIIWIHSQRNCSYLVFSLKLLTSSLQNAIKGDFNSDKLQFISIEIEVIFECSYRFL